MSPVTFAVLGFVFGASVGALLGVMTTVLMMVAHMRFDGHCGDEICQAIVLSPPFLGAALGACLSAMFFYRIGRRENAMRQKSNINNSSPGNAAASSTINH